MERNRRRQSKSKFKSKAVDSEEVSSIEWENIIMSEQEEDLIYRMHKLVGDRWDLIAGRIPGRTAEQVERFWIMRHSEGFAFPGRRKENNKKAKNGVFIH
ncbi:MYB-like transcription factor ETC3 [Punica granatum]|uniref:MYB-like transcription factor ETC3 n=2 Tax=Punica granatum TaxID=22663 RepID=A0A6P8CG03_PUNGR|nr:MYB-like transcription factor ETC3 [Punica granatum]XP_031383002.1 MYB-like transcription factor ETC3 [Punica granatum]OWM75562.1 hypothetical protein CDL15_Pgr021726 [Punica granatum]PKI52127.1 hypothetical protein CRG98_027543 [Punica granatum]